MCLKSRFSNYSYFSRGQGVKAKSHLRLGENCQDNGNHIMSPVPRVKLKGELDTEQSLWFAWGAVGLDVILG